jgi:hypothetical protein
MWPFARSHWVFEAPPCICGDIEAQVRDACAMRDEMATWPTPLEAWKKLQEAQMLVPKGQSKPFVDPWGSQYQKFLDSAHISTMTVLQAPVTRQRAGTWQMDLPPTRMSRGRYAFSMSHANAAYIDIGWTILHNAESYQVLSITTGVKGAVVETMKLPVSMYESHRPLPRIGVRLQLRPGESYEVGTILERGTYRYEITRRLFDNTNQVEARLLK